MNFAECTHLSLKSDASDRDVSSLVLSTALRGTDCVESNPASRSNRFLSIKANITRSLINLQEFSESSDELINRLSELIQKISLEWEANPNRIVRGRKYIELSNKAIEVIAQSAIDRMELIDRSNLIALQAIQDCIEIKNMAKRFEFENQSQLLAIFQNRSLLSIASDLNLSINPCLYNLIEHSGNQTLFLTPGDSHLNKETVLEPNLRSNTFGFTPLHSQPSSSQSAQTSNDHVITILDQCNQELRDVEATIHRITQHCSTFQDEMRRLISDKLSENDIHIRIDELCQEFLDGIEFHLGCLVTQLKAALSLKNSAFNAQADYYSKTMKMLEELSNAYTVVIPSYSIYGCTFGDVEVDKKELLEGQIEVIQQIKGLILSSDLKEAVQNKINQTLKSIKEHKVMSLEALRKNLPQSGEAAEIIQEGNKLFAQGMVCFLSLASETINRLMTATAISIELLLQEQDNRMVLLAEKTARAIEFLDYETRKIIELAEVTQKPLISAEIGHNIGAVFDDLPDISQGRISQINVRAGWWVDGLQCEYKDKSGKKHKGVFHGGNGGELHKISLSASEKITKISVGYGAWHHAEGSGVEEITFHVQNNRGAGHHTYGPYGRSGCPEALDDLRRVRGRDRLATSLKIKEITFGSNYYLGAVKGRETRYISSLTFYFFRDYSSILKRDLTERLKETLDFLKEL